MTQPGNEPGSVVKSLAMQCSALDCCAAQEACMCCMIDVFVCLALCLFVNISSFLKYFFALIFF